MHAPASGSTRRLARGQAFAEAGADVIFIEAPENEEEIARIGETFDKPLLANMVDSGKTPIVPADRLAALGFNIAIYPAIGMLPAAGAMKSAFAGPQARRLDRKRQCANDLAARDARAHGLRGRLGVRAPLGPTRGRGGRVDADAPA